MKRRQFLKLAGAGLVGLTLAGSGLKMMLSNPKQQISVYSSEGLALWEKAINKNGFHITTEICQKYQLLKRHIELGNYSGEQRKSLERKLLEDMNGDYKKFQQTYLPEDFNQGTFLKEVITLDIESKFIRPRQVSEIFDLDYNHKICKELKNNLPKDDDDLVRKLINCSLLITQKHLEATDGECPIRSNQDFFNHLKQGIGDCTEYTFGTANNYYMFCTLFGRLDLASKIRIKSGIVVNAENKTITHHHWIDYFSKNMWNFLDTKATDLVRKHDKIHSNMDVLLIPIDMRNKYIVPLTSTVFEADKKTGKSALIHRAYILPQ